MKMTVEFDVEQIKAKRWELVSRATNKALAAVGCKDTTINFIDDGDSFNIVVENADKGE